MFSKTDFTCYFFITQSCLHTQYLLVCERSEVIAFPAELCLYKPLRKDKDCSIQGCLNDMKNKSGSCIMHKKMQHLPISMVRFVTSTGRVAQYAALLS